MKIDLSALFWQPESRLYQACEWLNQHLFCLLTSTICLICLLPSYFLGDQLFQLDELETQIPQLQAHNQQQQSLLDSLKAYQSKQQNAQNVLKINQQLNNLATQHHAKITQLQWQFEGEKTIALVVLGKTSALLPLVQTLNQQPHFQFKQLTFHKQPNYQIQLTALLLIKDFK
ncbi:hypothetical protein A4G19_02690 [Pasteurellaceae bacterium Macca]|nr:hypothetical protein [Pasteurellaceae bacterium Macca]